MASSPRKSCYCTIGSCAKHQGKPWWCADHEAISAFGHVQLERLQVLHGLRIRRRLPVGPARWTLSDSRGLDSLTSDMLHGAHLAQIRIASRTPDDQHGAEPGRAESCRTDPTGEVSVRPMRGPRELAAALAEFRHFRADLGGGIGTFPQQRSLRACDTVLYHCSAVLPKAGLKERQVHRSSDRCRLVVRAARWLGVGVSPVSEWR